MNPMPSRSMLQDALGRQFRLEAPDAAVQVTLVSVQQGVAMTPQHTCYRADFQLPAGVQAAQAVFRLCHPDNGQDWHLMMTPLRPGADGRHVLQAVFHYETAEVAAAAVKTF